VSGGADGPRDRPQQEEERVPITEEQEAAQLPIEPIDPPDEPDEPPPNLADGALLRDQDKQEIWVMCGGARFWVPSSQEFTAMGYNSAQVQVVPPGTVARIPRVPRDGTLFKDRTPLEVYAVFGGRKYWVPTQDALFCMGRNWGQVRTIPNGSAATLQDVGTHPGSGTPGSLVFPPNGQQDGHHFARSDVATTVRLLSQGREVRLIELRGWLRVVGEGCNDDPDWHYLLEVDTAWAASRGIDLSGLFKVGDMLSMGDFNSGAKVSPQDNVFKNAVATPRINMELNAWGWSQRFPPSGKPTDWNFSGAVNCPADRVWPFDPIRPPGFQSSMSAGQYVRVVGSLVTDAPHVAEDWIGHAKTWFLPSWMSDVDEKRRAAQATWGNYDDKSPTHPARYSEVHPPDRFDPLSEPPLQNREGVRGVAIVASNGAISGEERTVEFLLCPPAPRPSGTAQLMVREHVGPDTNYKTIFIGNAAKSGAQINTLAGGMRVRVGVRGEGGWGAPGKFKGIYRTSWTAGGSPGQPARYGANIKAVHWVTGHTLHSHAINYSHSGSSKQQQVTCFGALDDNDWWRIKGPHGSPDGYKAGQAVQHGDIIRLEHVLTKRNLHSHGGFPSPVTRQQEVTCFGSNGIGDGNDNWRVEVEGEGTWAFGKRLRLVHVSTNHALHSHAWQTHPTYTVGQQEVTGYSLRDDNDRWYLFEGG
jgi:hypothetical protein